MSREAGFSQETLPPTTPSVRPDGTATRSLRAELLLAILPTAVVLCVFGLIESYTQQRLLFTSLASSAFLIYLTPEHITNSVRTLLIAQASAAVIGAVCHVVLGGEYAAAAVAMVGIALVMLLADAMHPPAASTALAFAFKDDSANSLAMFGLATGLLVVLIALQRVSAVLSRRLRREPAAKVVTATPVDRDVRSAI